MAMSRREEEEEVVVVDERRENNIGSFFHLKGKEKWDVKWGL